MCKNLKLGGLSEVPPLLHHMVPVHITELQPEFTDDVMFLESVEVKNLHNCRGIQERRLGDLQENVWTPADGL